jgi:hypothetical protein
MSNSGAAALRDAGTAGCAGTRFVAGDCPIGVKRERFAMPEIRQLSPFNTFPSTLRPGGTRGTIRTLGIKARMAVPGHNCEHTALVVKIGRKARS